jgi:hypothetical protein
VGWSMAHPHALKPERARILSIALGCPVNWNGLAMTRPSARELTAAGRPSTSLMRASPSFRAGCRDRRDAAARRRRYRVRDGRHRRSTRSRSSRFLRRGVAVTCERPARVERGEMVESGGILVCSCADEIGAAAASMAAVLLDGLWLWCGRRAWWLLRVYWRVATLVARGLLNDRGVACYSCSG